MAKMLTFSGPRPLQTALCQALRDYAEAAYPPGGSECGQVARAALMDAAVALETGFAESGSQAEVSRRLRAHIKAAVTYYCEQHEGALSCACLERFITGEPVTEQQFESGCQDSM